MSLFVELLKAIIVAVINNDRFRSIAILYQPFGKNEPLTLLFLKIKRYTVKTPVIQNLMENVCYNKAFKKSLNLKKKKVINNSLI